MIPKEMKYNLQYGDLQAHETRIEVALRFELGLTKCAKRTKMLRMGKRSIQRVMPNICDKFQDPRCSSSREMFDKKALMYCIGEKEGK